MTAMTDGYESYYEAVKEAEFERPPPPDYWERKSYEFDNFFVTDPMAKVYCLTAANIFFMIIFGTCFHLAGSQDGDIVENFWMGFTFAADMVEDDHGGPFPYWQEWIFRIMNVVFSFGGATIFGMVSFPLYPSSNEQFLLVTTIVT